MKRMFAWSTKRPSAPREPLFTLEEIADRLHVPVTNLRGALHGRRPADYPAPPAPAMTSPGVQGRNLYRLSDFRRWMRALEDAGKLPAWAEPVAA